MSSPDAHLYATDAALYSHGLDPGPDLYATDAALFAPALDPGPDLYATDADLFADAGDRATAALRALERWLVARSFARETDPRGTRTRRRRRRRARCAWGRCRPTRSRTAR